MPSSKSQFSAKVWMKSAIEMASRAKGSVYPNPKVGAVIVYRNRIVGVGFHRGPGLPHAEVNAIEDARRKGFKSFHRSTLFVSMEPCCHLLKRTPPCAPLVAKLRFQEVVVSHLDPNPAVQGKGMAYLRQSGVRVRAGLLKNEAELLNQAFIKNQTQNEAYLTLKVAMTFDGKMADDFDSSQWITSEKARADVHKIRHGVDAIGIGSGTLRQDQPRLNVRLKSKVECRKIVIFGAVQKKADLRNILKNNVPENIIEIANARSQRPKDILRMLYRKYGICHLLVEGGAKLASSLLKAGAVDHLIIYYGRGILGGTGRHSLGRAWGLKRLKTSIRFTPSRVELMGHDLKTEGLLHVYGTHTKYRRSGKK